MRLVGSCSPVLTCLRDYSAMLMDPMQTAGAILVRHLLGMSNNIVCKAFHEFYGVVVVLLAKIWVELQVKFESWPYKLLLILHGTVEIARQVISSLYAAAECCLDEGIALS